VAQVVVLDLVRERELRFENVALADTSFGVGLVDPKDVGLVIHCNPALAKRSGSPVRSHACTSREVDGSWVVTVGLVD
jgi:hypothetical protein